VSIAASEDRSERSDERSREAPMSSYDEPARSYLTLWPIWAFFVVGIGLDAGLSGAGFVSHLPGWALAVALVGGLFWLMIYAVRSQKSLQVTADEVRVGDEALTRQEIAVVAAGIDNPELPVLGWPSGAPRKLTGVTVRLTDGRDVAVPSRYPDRLIAVLGGAGELPGTGQQVRAAARSELPLLDDLATRADQVFHAAGYELPDVPLDVAALAGAKAVFVAGRPPIGFVQVDEVDGLAHIAQLGVVPRWMRQGIGTALLERACEWAKAHDYPAVTLITYAEVPWNGPYYAARGFAEIEPTPGLAALREHEAELGLDDLGPRIVMRRDL
jgi:GNAT superfamily N-acetyltransferase